MAPQLNIRKMETEDLGLKSIIDSLLIEISYKKKSFTNKILLKVPDD